MCAGRRPAVAQKGGLGAREFREPGFGRFSEQTIVEVLRRIAEICGDCNFPVCHGQKVLWRVAKTTNPNQNCAEEFQNPGS